MSGMMMKRILVGGKSLSAEVASSERLVDLTDGLRVTTDGLRVEPKVAKMAEGELDIRNVRAGNPGSAGDRPGEARGRDITEFGGWRPFRKGRL